MKGVSGLRFFWVFALAVAIAWPARVSANGFGADCGNAYGDLDKDQKAHSKKRLLIAAGVTLVSAVGLGVGWGLATTSFPGKVASTNWEHTIEVQNFTVVTQEHWCAGLRNSAPVMPVNGAGEQSGLWNIQSRGTRFSHFYQQYIGSDSKGNPEYINVPVYENWCAYDSYQWTTVRTERTSGINPLPSDGPLAIPQVSLAKHERQLEMKRNYQVEIHYEREGIDRTHVAQPTDEATFRSWTPGSDMRITRNNFGFVRKVEKVGE